MDQTLKSILTILEEGTPELKIAACQVIGQLQPKEAPVAKALAERLSVQESFLTPFVLDALAAIGNQAAITVLVSKLGTGAAIGERVSHLLSQMGAQVTKALEPMFDSGDPETQDRVLAILGRHKDKEALTILRKAVLSADPRISEKPAEVLRGHLSELDDKQRSVLEDGLQKALTAKSAGDLEPFSIAQGLGVYGELVGAEARTLLLKLATPKNDPLVRQSALRALEGIELTPAQKKTILSYLPEEDMTHVVRPAMQLLAGETEWNAAAFDLLEPMLEARSEERRLFSLRALVDRHTVSVAKIGIKALLTGVPEFEEAALAALSANPKALEPLRASFVGERNVERARLLAKPLSQLGSGLDATQRKNLVERASKMIAGGDPMGDVYLNLLTDIDFESGCTDLVDKAVRLRRARRLEDCLSLLARMAHAERINAEGRYQLAVARLMMDAKEGHPNDAAGEGNTVGDATMGYFSVLIREGFPVLDRVKKEGQLEPDDLFRLARHFATGVAAERRFGGELLHFVATKHGRRKVGEEAKLVLRSEGL